METILTVISLVLVAALSGILISYIRYAQKKLLIKDEAERMILDQIFEAIIQTDQHFIVTRWNRRAEKIFGWTAQEVIGKNIGEFVKGDNRDDWMEFIRIVKTHGSNFSDFTQLTKTGSQIIIAISTSLLKDHKGKTIGTISVLRDITFRKFSKHRQTEQVSGAEAILEQQLAEIEVENTALSQLNNTLHQNIEREKNEIAGKLFDELGQDLSSVKVTLSLISEEIKNENPYLTNLFHSSLNKIEEIFQSVKQLSNSLSPKIIGDIGFFPALKDYCEQVKKQKGITIEMLVDIAEENLSSEQKHFLFNSSKKLCEQIQHNGIKKISIEIKRQRDIHYTIHIHGPNPTSPSFFEQLVQRGQQLRIRTRIKESPADTFITFIIPSES